jgi:hypothetical protein
VKLETEADGACSGALELGGIAYSSDGKALNQISKKIPLRPQPDVLAKMQRVAFQLQEEIDLPQGDLFLQTGINDLTAHHAGTLEIPLHVVAAPPMPK